MSTTTVNGRTVVAVSGEVDMYSAPTLRDRLSDLLDSGHNPVIVDLSDVGFLDSTGIGALVASLNHAKELGASLPVVCGQDRILKLFQITGLHAVFSIYPSVDDAVAASPDSSEQPS